MQLATVGKITAGVAAFGVGAGAAALATRGRDPWTLDYGGPGSIEQVPSMLLPWGLPAIGAGVGAAHLMHTGHPKAGAAAALGALALYGAGFTTWMVGRSRGD